MPNPVPILITWDVDPSPEIPFEFRQQSLDVTVRLGKELGIGSTFFVTANANHATPSKLEMIQAAGNEIGCHGLTHENEEEFDQMPEAMQYSYLQQATTKLEKLSGGKVRVFRSPRVKISATTIKLLVELGYIADSSVCSQRLDVFSSNLINLGWLVAPRLPYRPRYDNVYRRGDSDLWEIPISAIGIPFISAFLGVLGLVPMKALFRLLYAESRQTGKPIVYLGHPIEFTSGWLKPFSWKELTPGYIRTHGLLLRKRLYRLEPEAWLNTTQELFAYIKTFPGTEFMSVGEYALKLPFLH
jgi:peptidoglycan/xylan/chitin deacetylase (PgdA/CDA1 family)